MERRRAIRAVRSPGGRTADRFVSVRPAGNGQQHSGHDAMDYEHTAAFASDATRSIPCRAADGSVEDVGGSKRKARAARSGESVRLFADLELLGRYPKQHWNVAHTDGALWSCRATAGTTLIDWEFCVK